MVHGVRWVIAARLGLEIPLAGIEDESFGRE
jgi:hypothetical protein